MMLLEACAWLKSTPLSLAIRQSKWGFALIEMGHLLALAVLGGALLILFLRIFGVILKGQALADSARDLGRLIAWSLLGMAISGGLLFTEGPLRYYANSAFRLKLLLIAVAALSAAVVYRVARNCTTTGAPPWGMRTVAAISLTFWLGAAIAGRVIGVL